MLFLIVQHLNLVFPHLVLGGRELVKIFFSLIDFKAFFLCWTGSVRTWPIDLVLNITPNLFALGAWKTLTWRALRSASEMTLITLISKDLNALTTQLRGIGLKSLVLEIIQFCFITPCSQ